MRYRKARNFYKVDKNIGFAERYTANVKNLFHIYFIDKQPASAASAFVPCRALAQ